MGTRNITRVIYNGEVEINQYCQWDGYPTGQALELLSILREAINDCGISTIKRCLDSSQLLDVGGSDVYTGAPYRKDIFNKFYGLLKGFDSSASIFNRLVLFFKAGELTEEEVKYLVVALRDIGKDVLKFIIDWEPENIIFYTDEYLINIKPEGDWQIEAMYIVNLDSETVEIWWHGKAKTYAFAVLATLTDETLYNDMKELEA